MAERTIAAHRSLFEGVSSVEFAGFPDHGNVGDSAIALGMLRFLAENDIGVSRIHSVGGDPAAVSRQSRTVLFQGGGNLGGLYPHVDAYRARLVAPDRLEQELIHGPQSIAPVAGRGTEHMIAVVSRPRSRLAVRDNASREIVKDRVDALLSPDSVHVLGHIEAADPVVPYVVLARTDDEAAGGMAGAANPVDWLRDPVTMRVATQVRWQLRRLGGLGRRFEPSDEGWLEIAAARLARGVAVLARGEVVVTDRLHAMLIALQLGRPVIAVDNNNGKLSSYAQTWFGDVPSDELRFAGSARAALELVG